MTHQQIRNQQIMKQQQIGRLVDPTTRREVDLVDSNDLINPNLNIYVNKELHDVWEKKMNEFKKRQKVFLVPAVETNALCLVRVMMKWYNHISELGGSKFLFPNLKGDFADFKVWVDTGCPQKIWSIGIDTFLSTVPF